MTGDLRFLGNSDMDTLVALVMELAAQVHEERAQRITLEAALEDAGVLAPGVTAHPSDAARERSGDALGRAMMGLLRVMAESGPPQHPIRSEARHDAWAVRHG